MEFNRILPWSALKRDRLISMDQFLKSHSLTWIVSFLLLRTTGFYILAWGLLTFIFFICSLRTNVVFATLFFSLDVLFGLLAGAYLCLADGQSNLAGNLTIVSHSNLFTSRFCSFLWACFLWVVCASRHGRMHRLRDEAAHKGKRYHDILQT